MQVLLILFELMILLQNLFPHNVTKKQFSQSFILYFDSKNAIVFLKKNGTFLPDNITKHIEENIWELRPGNNRIFYFFHEQETFILLHTFMKKSNKTPKREILKAKRERDDYLIRKEHLNI